MPMQRRVIQRQILLFLIAPLLLQAQTASQVWQDLQRRILRAPETHLVFQGPSGDRFELFYQPPQRFHLRTPDFRIYSDGTTLWIYQLQARKMIITTLNHQLITPVLALLLDTTHTPQKLSLLRAMTSENADIRWILRLTFSPTAETVHRAELFLSPNFTPRAIKLYFANGKSERWEVLRWQSITPHAASFFTPEIPDSVEVIDLRSQKKSQEESSE